MKVHIHEEQFDGHPHAWCGRGATAVPEAVFEATPRQDRCQLCDRDWFLNGQPDWHFNGAVANLATMQRTP